MNGLHERLEGLEKGEGMVKQARHFSLKHSRRLIRLLCVLTLVTTSAVAPSGSGAADEPSQEAPQAAPAWTYKSDATYPEGDINGRMEFEGIGHDEAVRRFKAEDATSPLEAKAMARWPLTYAGMWIEHDPHGVKVAFTSGAEANLEELKREDLDTVNPGDQVFPFLELLHPVDAEVALAVLRSIQTLMRTDRVAVAAGAGLNLPQVIRETKGYYDLSSDVPGGKLEVWVDEPNDQLLDAFRATYTERLVLRKGRAKQGSCTQTDCLYAMMGGLQIYEETGVIDRICSSAFTAYYNTNPSTRYVLTAGHCFKNHYAGTSVNQQWYHAGVNYGYTNENAASWSGTVDAARIRKTTGLFRESSKSWIQNENPRMIDGYMTHAAMPISGGGSYVYKSGATTNTTRGYVSDKTYAPGPPNYPANSYNYIKANYCAMPGDSGGAVGRSSLAWGIVSGAIGGTHCLEDSTHEGTGDAGFFTSIEYDMNRLGVSLLANLNLTPHAWAWSNCGGTNNCQFHGSDSWDEDGSVTSYSWNFGDGATSTAANPYHVYQPGATYCPSLTVRDNNGATNSDSYCLTIPPLNQPTLDSAARTDLVTCNVNISWSPPGSGLAPDSYYLTNGVNSWTVGASPTSMIDTTTQPATAYNYQVFSRRGSWWSGGSNVKSVSTGVCVRP